MFLLKKTRKKKNLIPVASQIVAPGNVNTITPLLSVQHHAFLGLMNACSGLPSPINCVPPFLSFWSHARLLHRRTMPHSLSQYVFLSPLPREHVLKEELEAVAQGAHVRVHGLLQLKGMGNDLDGPVLELGMLAGLEAEMEVARVLGVDAEGVHAPFRVGFRVGRQPSFWKTR